MHDLSLFIAWISDLYSCALKIIISLLFDTNFASHSHIADWICVYRPYQHAIGHFGDDSFQSIIWTGTDNETGTTKRLDTENTESSCSQSKWPRSALEKNTKH